MSDPVADDLHAWADTIAGPGSTAYANALVASALSDIVNRRIDTDALDAAIAAKTAQRDQIRTQRTDVQTLVAGYEGQTFTITGTVTSGQTTVTGDFAGMNAIVSGAVLSPTTHFAPGTTITDWATGTLTIDLPAKASGTVTIRVQTGSLAAADALIKRLYVQTVALQQALADAEDSTAINATITDGRAALVAAGHYLLPASVPSGPTGTDPATLADATAGLNTHLGTTVGSGTSGTPKWAHLWRSRVYRVDGTVAASSKNWWRLDSHGSRFAAVVAGSSTRAHLRLTDCTNTLVTRYAVRGALPIVGTAPPPPAPGLPAPLPPPQYNGTYGGQHGIEILGGSVTIDRPDISDVCGQCIRVGSGASAPTSVTVQGVGACDRAGNHIFGVATGADIEWSTVTMGASGRDTIAVSPAAGVTVNGVNLHDFRITGAVTDFVATGGSYYTLTAASAGKITGFTFKGVTAEAAHGPIVARIAAQTSGQKTTDVVITDNVGAGTLLTTGRAAWTLSNITNVSFRRNSQQMGQPRTGDGGAVMYGAKGSGITGTIDVGANALGGAAGEALFDGTTYPAVDPPPPPPGGSWPDQTVQGTQGITLNIGDPDWKVRATGIYDYLKSIGREGEWDEVRVQVDWSKVEPNPPVNGVHSYNWTVDDIDEKVAWAHARDIDVILDGTFTPYWAQDTVDRTCNVVAGTSGNARLVGGTLASNENYLNILARCDGKLPAGTLVTAIGSTNGVVYAQTNKPAVALGTNVTVTFGGYRVNGQNYNSGDTNHMGVAAGHLDDLAAFAAAGTAKLQASAADPKIRWEYRNEANGDHGYRLKQDAVAYCLQLMYFYAGIKQFNPNVLVYFTGLNNNNGTSATQRSLDAPYFLRRSVQAMKGTLSGSTIHKTWQALCASTAGFVVTSGPGAGTHKLSDLIASGDASPMFWVDKWGWHAYNIYRVGGGAYSTWLDKGVNGVLSRFCNMLNILYDEDPSPGKDTINLMGWVSTETGQPHHPLALTTIGATKARVGIDQPLTASCEEYGLNITIIKQLEQLYRPMPTGLATPPKAGVGDPRKRWSTIIYQRLSEVGESYQGADLFANTGFYPNTDAPGPPKWPAGKLKRAIPADVPRPTLAPGDIYDGVKVGPFCDGVDAFAQRKVGSDWK